MTREKLIQGILTIKPNILSKEVLETLPDNTLLLIYSNNRFLSYYQATIKDQKVSVIKYVYEEKYTREYLYTLSEEDFEALYLSAIKMTKAEFDKMVQEGLEEFMERAKAEGNGEFMAFTEEEQIIASSVIIPNNLLTEEEFVTKSILLRIHEITEEIKDLKEDNDNTEKLLETEQNYLARGEFQSDISSNNLRIWKLEAELKALMNPNNNEDLSKTRSEGQPR